MAADTKNPLDTQSAMPAERATGKAAVPKRVVRPRASKTVAPATENTAPTPSKSKPPARKVVARPLTEKARVAKNATPEPTPFVTKNSKEDKPEKARKAKLVRDSFTMPDGEYEQIAALKKRCLKAGVAAKKSEILRAAVANLAKLSDSSLLSAVRRLEVIKTGRPAKAKDSK